MENLLQNTEHSILQNKVESLLSARSKPIAEAIAQIERTGSLLDDYIVPMEQIVFTPDREKGHILLTFDEDARFGLHQHAVRQIGGKLNIPVSYLQELAYGNEEWQRFLAINILQTHTNHATQERVLIRAVENEVRGFLSDRYRRLNSMEIFTAFLLAAQSNNSVLVDAYAGETKGFLEVINPKIVAFDTPQNGKNYACFGARIRNSDFGDGALEVRTFMLNVRCMNGLVGESLLREFHLGNRIPDNITVSEETYRKETAARAALVTDIMNQIYQPEHVDRMIQKIEGASAQRISISREIERLPKLGLSIGEVKAVEKVLMENDPENGLEGSPTLWKLVNAMTAVARDAQPERKRDLELIASDMLN